MIMYQKNKIVYVDLDGVMVNLDAEIKRLDPILIEQMADSVDNVPEIFIDPDPIKDAITSYQKLVDSGKYDVYIASTAPWGNPEAWMYKRLWVERYIGSYAYKKLILTHNKGLLKGDYLIDDRLANGSDLFEGELIRFSSEKFPDWNSVLNYLI